VKRLLLFLVPLLLSAIGVHALVVKGYDPAVNDRFSSGYPGAPVPNKDPQFIGKDLDWSGVGWWKKDPQYSVTLITPKNFACTYHMAPSVGDVIRFLGRDGILHEYHVAKLQWVDLGKKNGEIVEADTGVGTFTETVPFEDQVTHYPVAVSPNGAIDSFIGKKILTYGHMARIATNEIVEGLMVNGVASEYSFYTDGLSTGMGKVEVGDSGSPVFMVINGKLALVGTHWKIDTDSMVSGLVAGINALLANDDEKLDLVPLGN
jgi:hypothetical protein